MATWTLTRYPRDPETGAFGSAVQLWDFLQLSSLNIPWSGVATPQSAEFKLIDTGLGDFAADVPDFGDMIVVRRDADIKFLGWVTIAERADVSPVAGWVPSVRIVAEDLFAKLQRVRLPIYERAKWKTDAAKAQENPSGLRSGWRAALRRAKRDPQTPHEFMEWVIGLLQDVEQAKDADKRLPLTIGGIVGTVPQLDVPRVKGNKKISNQPFVFDNFFPFVADGLSYWECLDAPLAMAGLNWTLVPTEPSPDEFLIELYAWPADPEQQTAAFIGDLEFADDPQAVLDDEDHELVLARTINVRADASSVVNRITYTWNPIDPETRERRPTQIRSLRNLPSIRRYGQRDETMPTTFFTRQMAHATAWRRLRAAKDADLRGTVRIPYHDGVEIGRTYWIHKRHALEGNPVRPATLDADDFWSEKAQLWGVRFTFEDGVPEDPIWMDLDFSRQVYKPVRFTPFVPPPKPPDLSGPDDDDDGTIERDPDPEGPAPGAVDRYIVPVGPGGFYRDVSHSAGGKLVPGRVVASYRLADAGGATKIRDTGWENIEVSPSLFNNAEHPAVVLYSRAFQGKDNTLPEYDPSPPPPVATGDRFQVGQVAAPACIYVRTQWPWSDRDQVRKITMYLAFRQRLRDTIPWGEGERWITGIRVVPDELLPSAAYADPPSPEVVEALERLGIVGVGLTGPVRLPVTPISTEGITRLAIECQPIEIDGNIGASVVIFGAASEQPIYQAEEWGTEARYASASLRVSDGATLISGSSFLRPDPIAGNVNDIIAIFNDRDEARPWLLDPDDGTAITRGSLTTGGTGNSATLAYDAYDVENHGWSFATFEMKADGGGSDDDDRPIRYDSSYDLTLTPGTTSFFFENVTWYYEDGYPVPLPQAAPYPTPRVFLRSEDATETEYSGSDFSWFVDGATGGLTGISTEGRFVWNSQRRIVVLYDTEPANDAEDAEIDEEEGS